MSKYGFYSGKSGQITFESHLESLQEQKDVSLLNLRNFVKSLGGSIIEEGQSP
jgi:hypothetical protein